MSLVMHIVGKDLRRLRWYLAGPVAFTAMKLAIGFSLLFTGGFRFFGLADQDLKGTLTILTVAEQFLVFVVTAMLVQGDSLVGTTPFWITRPISGGRLLAAKGMGWLLLVWAPAVAVSLPWWLTCGFGVPEVARAAAELLAWMLVWALPGALVASLTDTLSRFLVWGLVLLFAAVTVPQAILAAVSGRAVPMPGLTNVAVFALVIIGVIAHQFLRRNWAKSLMWLGIAGLLGWPVAILLPVGVERLFGSNQPKWSDRQAERAEGVSLAVLNYECEYAPWKLESEAWLTTHFAATGVPRGFMLQPGDDGVQTWRWTGGPVVTREVVWGSSWDRMTGVRDAIGLVPLSPDPETELYFRKRREERVAQMVKKGGALRGVPDARAGVSAGVSVTSYVLRSTVARLQAAPPAYAAALRLRLLRPEVWLETPLLSGGWHARRGYGFRVGDTQPRIYDVESTTRSVNLEKVSVFSQPEFVMPAWFGVQGDRDDWRHPSVVLVNRATGDLQSWGHMGRSPEMTISAVGIYRWHQTIWWPSVRRGDAWVPREPKWAEGATMMLVGLREEARFTREVKADRYEAAK